jgi:hypothetical protein
MKYIIILGVLLVSILYFLYVKTKSRIENFVSRQSSRIDMDDVLDNYCSKETNGFDDYQFKWGTVNGEAICKMNECPTENCYELKPVNARGFLGDIPDIYQYVSTNSSTIQASSNVYPEGCRLNSDVQKWYDTENIECEPHEEWSCISKSVGNENLICDPTLPPSCYNAFANDECWIFTSNYGNPTKYWREINVKQFFDSTSNCNTKHIETPYQTVTHIKTEADKSKKNVIIENNCYSPNILGRRSCRLFKDGNKLKDEYRNEVHILGAYETYDADYNGFQCKNGGWVKYGHVKNSENSFDGFQCGWDSDKSNCSTCRLDEKNCYTFDSTDRTFSRQRFLNVYRDDDIYDTDKEESCGFFELKQDFIDTDIVQFMNSGKTSDTEEIKFNSNIYDSNNCRYVENPEKCKVESFTCTAYNENPRDNPREFVDVEYIRQWNINGSNCEYYINSPFHKNYVHGQSNVFVTESNFNTICDPGPKTCPKGLEFRSRTSQFENDKCIPCNALYDYYDDETKTCKSLREDGYTCPKGTYYNVNSNIFFDIDTTILSSNVDIILDKNVLTKENLDDNSWYYGTDKLICSPCSNIDPNQYMDEDNHIYTECKKCEHSERFLAATWWDQYYYSSNDECKRCDFNEANYIKVDTSTGKKSCVSCPESTDPFGTVVYNTDINECQLSCIGSGGGGDVIESAISYSDSKYGDGCDVRCDSHHEFNGTTCTACPIGTERYWADTSCTSCEYGYYNDEAGTSCTQCPSSRDLLGEPHTDNTGSSKSDQCYYNCLDDLLEPVTTVGKSNAVFNERLNQYDISTCYKYDCDDDAPPQTYTLCPGGLELTDVTTTANYILRDKMCSPHVSSGNAFIKSRHTCYIKNDGASDNQYCCNANDMTVSTKSSIVGCYCPSITDISTDVDPDTCDSTCNHGYTMSYSGECIIQCVSGQFRSTTNTCSNCPGEPENSNKPTSIIGSTSINQCKVSSCSDNYIPVGGARTGEGYDGDSYGFECEQRKVLCSQYILTTSPDNFTNTGGGTFKKRENTREVECTTSQMCPTDETRKQISDDDHLCCPSNTSYSRVNSYYERGEINDHMVLSDRFGCCPQNSNLKQTTGGNFKCCPTGEIAVDSISGPQCCGIPSDIRNVFAIYWNNSNSKCDFTCDSVSNTDTVSALSAPNAVYARYTKTWDTDTNIQNGTCEFEADQVCSPIYTLPTSSTPPSTPP